MLEYYEDLSVKMNNISFNPNASTAIFTDGKGGYETVESLDSTFDEMIDRMAIYNMKADKQKSRRRCIMIKSPNRILRELGGHKESMLTFCAPMKNKVIENFQTRGSAILGDEYLVSDRRQEAADIVGYIPELLNLAKAALNLEVSIEGKKPFEGAPL